MKKLVFYILLIGFALTGAGQNYVDLAKFTHTQIPNCIFKNNQNTSTSITQTKLYTSVPISINDSLAFLTGIDYEVHRLKINPMNTSFSNLHLATLKLGFNLKHNKKLSGIYLALPKVASDLGNLNKSFQIGAIALWKYSFSTQTKLIFGNYINTERFGILNVPILGVYHISKNEKTEVDIKFPINGFGDYKFHKNFRVGADFLLIVRTFDLAKPEVEPFYIHTASNEVAGYIQFDLFKEALVIKVKAVYAMYDYGLYADLDGTSFGMLGWYPGDKRMRLNSEVSGAIGFKISAFYRFQL